MFETLSDTSVKRGGRTSRARAPVRPVSRMTPAFPLHRFAEFSDLTACQCSALESLTSRPQRYEKRAIIRTEDSPTSCVWLLHSGWVGAAVNLPNAKRQLVKVHLPGDVLGSSSMCLERAGDTLEAISDAVVSAVSYSTLGQIFVNDPRLAATFLLSVQKERVSLMHKLAEVGRVSAYERVAGMMLDLLVRCRQANMADSNVIHCPLTQEQIGDMLGLTNVHVNRMLRQMNDTGVIEGMHTQFRIVDEPRLRSLAIFQTRFARSPSWLPGNTPDHG